ncbi:MAG: YggT family protein [Campylobacter sp.]
MILSTFLQAVAEILHIIITAYTWVIIASALISWVQPDPFNPIVQLLHRLTQPAYNIVRRFIPTVFGGIDLAPVIILITLHFIDIFFVRLIFEFAM